jgi:hypothetical protein
MLSASGGVTGDTVIASAGPGVNGRTRACASRARAALSKKHADPHSFFCHRVPVYPLAGAAGSMLERAAEARRAQARPARSLDMPASGIAALA